MQSIYKIKSILRKILPILLVSVMLIEAPALVLSQTYTTSYPASTSITFISFQGNDAGGVLAFEHGQIAFYAYPLPPSMYTSLPPGVKVYLFPAAIYDVLVNPLNTTFGFNPFQFQEVRFALNYIVNREYFVNDILKGYGIPGISVYAGDPPVLYALPALSKYSNIHYNFTYANETIYKVLTAHGAQYINGKWYYNGKPIVIYVFVRTDTIVRKAYAEYLISQLEKLGFTVQEIPGNAEKEESLVYGSNPATAGWDIDIEKQKGWYALYGIWIPIRAYSTIWGSTPMSSYYGLAWGTYNTTQYESPQLLQEANEISELAKQALSAPPQDFDLYLNELVDLGVKMAVRIGLGLSLTPFYVLPNITGVYPAFAWDTILYYQTYLAIRNGTYPNVTIGVRYLAQSSLNPLGGYTDTYSYDIASALFAPGDLAVPGSEFTLPNIFTYKVVNASPKPTIPVPTDALVWNPEKQEITHVPPNTTAEVAIILNFAPLFNYDKFVDGQNITLADIIYMYIIACEAALNSSNPIYDSSVSASIRLTLQTVKGFKIINSTAIEIWDNSYSYVPLGPYNVTMFTNISLITEGQFADGAIQDFNPYPMYLVGYMPWQVYAAMAKVVAEGKAAWSEPVAVKKGIDWLSLVSPTDVQNILSALENLSAQDYIPKSLLEVENLSGITLVTPQQAEAGYQAAINFIKTYGNAMIGDGPFMLVAWQPSVSPPYAKIVKNPYFHLAPPALDMVEPELYTIKFVPPTTVYPGETLNGTVFGTPMGTTTTEPAAGVSVFYVLTAPNGTILLFNRTVTNSNGVFTFTLPSTLAPGTYTLTLGANSFTSTMVITSAYTLFVVPATSTTTIVPTITTTTTTTTTSVTTTTTTPTTTTTTTTTISGISTTTIGIIVAIVIIVIVIGVVFGVVRRR